MKIANSFSRFCFAALLSSIAACSSSDGAPAPDPVPPVPPPPGTLVGPAGGTVTGPNGARVVIPAGALSAEVRINIEVVTSGAPPLPTGFTASGPMFAFTPHGTTFAVPVIITLPFDPATVSAGSAPAFYKTFNSQTQWEQLAGASFGDSSASAPSTSFSFAQVVLAPLFVGEPVREWTFSDFRGRRMIRTDLASGRQDGGVLERFQEFGPVFPSSELLDHEIATLDGGTIAPDGIADGQVFSSADGVTYGAFAESPYGDARGPESSAGARTLLRQYQAYIKRSADATLRYTLTGAFVDLRDDNPGFSLGSSVDPICTYEQGRLDVLDACQDLVKGQLQLTVHAYTHATSPTSSGRTIYLVGGIAEAKGHRRYFSAGMTPTMTSRIPLWGNEDFEVDIFPDFNGLLMNFIGPRTYSIDLSGVAVGEEFTLNSTVLVEASNRQGDHVSFREQPSSAAAFLRDPLSVDGTSIEYSGLQPIPNPVLVPPVDEPAEPAPCTPGPAPDPLAGIIQFDAASYFTGEIVEGELPMLITRTGGTRGAVTATLGTSDISAVAGSDYVPLNTSVYFADGDAEARRVMLTILGDELPAEPDETLSLSLTQPGGCAAIGPQSTAVLTIHDDDVEPPAPAFTVGGTVMGLVGTGLVLQDLHQVPLPVAADGPFTFTLPTQSGLPYAVTVLSQPDNPIQSCSVANGSGTVGDANITHVAVICAPPVASGALDATFGGTGKVTTAFGGTGTAMATLSNGTIVMVGGSSSDFALALYAQDGSLITSLTTDIASGNDRAYGVAIQSDGKIVVVGKARSSGNDNFALVRYTADGAIDPTFGAQGKISADFNGGTDEAHGVVIQPDGKIVVVGQTTLPAPAGTDFAIARFHASGEIDSTFDVDGKVTIDMASGTDLGRNVALQGTDIVVSGLITTLASPVLGHAGLARLDANGALDTGFAAAGKQVLTGTALGEAMVLQADGKILVGGNAVGSGLTQFGLMRLTADGAPDPSFGGGLVLTSFTTLGDYGYALSLDANGRVLLAGQSANQANSDFAVSRYTADGVLDTGFDSDGKLTIDFFGSFDGAESVLVQPDGKIVLGGYARNGASLGYGLVRVNP